MKAVKDALQEGFGVPPARVVQSSYEPIQYDETGALCGAQPTLGMDVHPGLRLGRQRLQETADFLKDFLARLECIDGGKGRGCPSGLATGSGTGFTLVTDTHRGIHQARLCARDPSAHWPTGRHAYAAPADERGRFQALFAAATPALRSPLAVVFARPTMPSSWPTPIAKARRCSTSCSPLCGLIQRARSHPTRRRTRSSPMRKASLGVRNNRQW